MMKVNDRYEKSETTTIGTAEQHHKNHIQEIYCYIERISEK